MRSLKDTPFSIDRLFVWTIGFTAFWGTIGLLVIAYQGKEIPAQLQSIVMFCLGAAAARIEKT